MYNKTTSSSSSEDWQRRNLLREKCPHSDLFWSVFSHIRSKFGPYSVRMRGNTDQNSSEYRHFLRSDLFTLRHWKKFLVSLKYGKTEFILFRLTSIFNLGASWRCTIRSEKIFSNWKPFKNDEKCFLFHLKSFKRYLNSCLDFLVM